MLNSLSEILPKILILILVVATKLKCKSLNGVVATAIIDSVVPNYILPFINNFQLSRSLASPSNPSYPGRQQICPLFPLSQTHTQIAAQPKN